MWRGLLLGCLEGWMVVEWGMGREGGEDGRVWDGEDEMGRGGMVVLSSVVKEGDS